MRHFHFVGPYHCKVLHSAYVLVTVWLETFLHKSNGLAALLTVDNLTTRMPETEVSHETRQEFGDEVEPSKCHVTGSVGKYN